MESNVVELKDDSNSLHLCSKCHIEKPLSEFYKHKYKRQGYCIACSKEYNHRYHRVKTPEQKRRNTLITSHGVTWEDYLAVLALQNNSCAICHRKLNATGDRFTRVDAGYIDHNHETGKLRGILCNTCNLLLGHCKDSIEILKNAVTYLEIHRL